MITLAIDTSSMPSTVALLQNEDLLEMSTNHVAKDTSSIITSQIDGLINNHLTSPRQIDRIVVTTGPGSFTGLRVGLATAKGLSMALQCDFIAINLFEVMVNTYLNEKDDSSEMIIPMINANKGNVFISTYKKSLNLFDPAKRVAINDLREKLISEKNSTLLPLNQCIIGNFVSSELNFSDITITAYEVGKSSISNLPMTYKEVAYVEPLYVVNNYNRNC